MRKYTPVWQKRWRWSWTGKLPRDRRVVDIGLARLAERLARGKVWVARFPPEDSQGNHYEGSYEKTPERGGLGTPTPKTQTPGARRSRSIRGRRKS